MPTVPARLSTNSQTNRYPLLGARLWHGMTLPALFRLLRAGGLGNVEARYWPMLASTMLTGPLNSALGAVQRWTHGARIDKLELAQPPLFILGHWRSGTTLLHELLSLDERHKAPTSLECFAPIHCLVSGRFLKKLRFLLPEKRPMDDMAFGWQRPQEDEFALLNMGLPSVYRQIGFPNNPPIDLETLDFDGVPAAEQARWREALQHFVKTVALRSPKKRIVLKSPQHLGRVGVLLEAFPDARFVHIMRNPHAVFPSTVKLWKSLFEIHALQSPRFEGLEEHVLSCFERLYGSFERDRRLVAAGRLHELRYEDLVADPAGELGRLYDGLGLGGFDRVRPGVEAYVRQTANHRTNVFEPDAATAAEIDRRWGRFMLPYGYCSADAPAGEAVRPPRGAQAALR